MSRTRTTRTRARTRTGDRIIPAREAAVTSFTDNALKAGKSLTGLLLVAFVAICLMLFRLTNDPPVEREVTQLGAEPKISVKDSLHELSALYGEREGELDNSTKSLPEFEENLIKSQESDGPSKDFGNSPEQDVDRTAEAAVDCEGTQPVVEPVVHAVDENVPETSFLDEKKQGEVATAEPLVEAVSDSLPKTSVPDGVEGEVFAMDSEQPSEEGFTVDVENTIEEGVPVTGDVESSEKDVIALSQEKSEEEVVSADSNQSSKSGDFFDEDLDIAPSLGAELSLKGDLMVEIPADKEEKCRFGRPCSRDGKRKIFTRENIEKLLDAMMQ